jgi:serine/threonine-protein kinase HipA
MRKARILIHGIEAGILIELVNKKQYKFVYHDQYNGPPVSLTMPVEQREYTFNTFPPFFEGLLPEGFQLEALLRNLKIDRSDLFSQLMAVGNDLVGAVTVMEEGISI